MDTANKTRVLYVEDDQALARLVRKRLQQLGYVVDLAFDAQCGQERFRSSAYDVLIVDQTLPEGNGLNLVRAIRGGALVAGDHHGDRQGNETIAVEAMKLGLSDYVVKDLEGGFLNLLPMVIENALDQHRLREEGIRMERELGAGAPARGRRSVGGRHRSRNQHAHPIHRRQYPFPQRCVPRYRRRVPGVQPRAAGGKDRVAHAGNGGPGRVALKDPDLQYLKSEIPKAIDQSLEGLSRVAAIVRAIKEFSHPGSEQKQNVDLAATPSKTHSRSPATSGNASPR